MTRHILHQAMLLAIVCGASVSAVEAQAQVGKLIGRELEIHLKPKPPVLNWKNLYLIEQGAVQQNEVRLEESSIRELNRKFVERAKELPLELLIEDMTKCLLPKHKDDPDCNQPQQSKQLSGFSNIR